jgi:polyketide synthase 12/myxalamid-type polyketide synthase MxaB
MSAPGPIAVVGAACRIPGGAETPEAFWTLLREGRDAVGELPAGRWDDALHDPDPRAPGRIHTRAGAFLPAVDGFDAEFFGIAPREAASLDPQHRLLLELCWEAVEGAGIAATSLRGSRTGVFVGIGQPQHAPHELYGPDPAAIGPYAATGTLLSFASGRVSHVLGLRGPCLSVDTACSSSLVALHLACRALRAGECDAALAAGVHLHLTPQVSLFLARTGVLAPDGRTKAFDAAADGFGRGEGGVVLLLRRLADALDAGDPVLGVVRGTAVNHDGAASGLTVPDAAAQEEVIRAALRDAGAAAAEIGLIEAHGTGTRLGDPIETEALARVFAPGRAAPLLLGAVKANIGHLEAAAGLAGVLKAMLALRHGEVPPQPGFRVPNPEIPWAALPFRVPTGAASPAPSLRLAGVSAFGMSGTNAHAVLEAPPAPPPAAPGRPGPALLVVSARTEAALAALARDTGDALAAAPDRFAAFAALSRSGRSVHRHRLALAAEDAAEAASALDLWLRERAHPAVRHGDAAAGRRGGIAFLFTGQGAQRAGMGRALHAAEPAFRAAIERCAAVLDPLLEVPLRHLVLEECDAAALRRTGNAQPALFAFEWALAELWRSWGVEPDVVIGHSLGEYVAATVAGCWTPEEALGLVAARARLMQGLPPGGAMASLRADAARAAAMVAPFGRRLSVAARNAPRLTAVSGEAAALEELLGRCAREGIAAQRLQVSHAFHSALMEPVLPALRDAIAACPPRAPSIELVCNLTGGIAAAAELADPERWCRHTREPVRFAEGMATLAALDVAACVEIGPAPVLAGLARQCVPGDRMLFLPSLAPGIEDARQMREALAALFAAGLAEGPCPAPPTGPRPALPRYPFQRRPIPLPGAGRAAHHGTGVLPGRRLPLPGSAEARFEVALPATDRFVSQHVVNGEVIVPAAWHLAAVAAAWRALHPGEPVTLRDILFAEPARLADGGLVVQIVLSPRGDGAWRFELMSRAAGDDPFAPGAWRRHASGDAARDASPLAEAPPAPAGGETAAALYDAVAAAGFALGPAFRWLRRLEAGDEAACAAALDPPADLAPVPGAPIHPGMLDSAFQLLSRFWPPGGGSFLPFRLAAFRLGARPAGLHGLRVLARREGAAEAGASPAARLVLADATGTVMEARGFVFRRAGAAPRPAVPAAAPARTPAAAPAPVPPAETGLEAAIRRAIAGVLGIAEPDAIEPRARLFDLGMDSMAALEARDAIEAALGRPLHATLLFDHPSIEALLRHLAPPPAAAAGPAVALDEAAIAALSEEEAERLLLLEIEREDR